VVPLLLHKVRQVNDFKKGFVGQSAEFGTYDNDIRSGRRGFSGSKLSPSTKVRTFESLSLSLFLSLSEII
jgi:hypothetical protein